MVVVTVGSLAATFALAPRVRGMGALALLAGAAAAGCGGRSHADRGTSEMGSDEGGASGSGARGGGSAVGGDGASGGANGMAGNAAGNAGSAARGGGAGTGAAGAESTVDYAGLVLMTALNDGTSDTYSAFAAFAEGQRADVRLDACSTCCCYHSIGISLPRIPPDAALIQIAGQNGETLASLAPSMDELQGSWVVNAWGIPGASSYALVGSEPWAPNDTLRVTATGNDIAPFAGEIRAGARFSGVIPEIGREPVAIDLTRPLDLTWSPENPLESVTLVLGQSGENFGLCICSAPDAARGLTLPGEQVAKFSAGPGTVQLLRSMTTSAPSDNASVTLASQVGVVGTVEFH